MLTNSLVISVAQVIVQLFTKETKKKKEEVIDQLVRERSEVSIAPEFKSLVKKNRNNNMNVKKKKGPLVV